MIYSRYRENDQGSADCDVLAEAIPPPGFALPINMMFIDARGEAWRGVLTAKGPSAPIH
jgi:hypothetical protein